MRKQIRKIVHEYKYTIHQRLLRLSVQDFDIAMIWLPAQLGITTATFRNWIYCKSSDHLEIPGTAILKMAAFFECKPSEMYTNPFNEECFKNEWIRQQELDKTMKERITNFYEAI